MTTIANRIIEFDLPLSLACPEPTENRNLERDDVRLLVTNRSGLVEHTTFNHFPFFMQQGDVLVVNTSATIPSAIPVLLPGARQGRVHLSTPLNERKWLIEIREITGNKTIRWKQGEEGMEFLLPSGGSVTLKQKFYSNEHWLQLWIADFDVDVPMNTWLAAHGSAIQYEKLDQQYPLSWYQTFFSFHPGSSEMPSAGRAFTAQIIERLLKKGVVLAPLVLHTGISSLEAHETPYPEYMEIDPVTASIINVAKSQDRRVIAVGTTCIRAIETAADNEGLVRPFRGHTNLFIDESYTMKIADGLLTGFHEPRASHLNMLQSVGGFEHINRAYQEAIKAGYYWHQFGDLHLIV